jgi:hypothetical protein
MAPMQTPQPAEKQTISSGVIAMPQETEALIALPIGGRTLAT